MADSKHSPSVAEPEIIITMIAGVIHRWIYWPGSWVPFVPQPGDLLRVWKKPTDKPQKPQ
jgi:hypothetical protein